MPDLMSHLLIGLILAELFDVRKKSLVALGAIMPDIFSKLDLIYFFLGKMPIVSFASFHTPLMCFLLSILVASLFAYSKIKAVFLLSLGSISHFLADLSIRHFNEFGTRFLFPFSMKNYTLSLIWPEQSIYVMAFSLIAYLSIIFVKKKINVHAGHG